MFDSCGALLPEWLVAEVHDRMPVILEATDFEQ
jgi:putative SOS response-associated peptidase YedK